MRLGSRGGLRLLLSRVLGGPDLVCALSTTPLDVRRPADRRALVDAVGLDPARAVSPVQVHGADVVQVRGSPVERRPRADALVTDVPGLPLLLRAADCSLVVVADPVRRAVGVAHAGWRGSAAGIVGNLVDALRAAYGTDPSECGALVGPTIGVARYPVGPEVPAAFARTGAWPADHVVREGERLHFDLAGANAHLLSLAGIPREAIEVSPLCTYEAAHLLHSYRRSGAGTGHHGLVAAVL